mmetsp:Transcript_32485/g.85941  ORF Transcript_32485/g.85941 Transcript_32485/m.85941 type:complete len:208 (-) Transcript_32485:11-634(-)
MDNLAIQHSLPQVAEGQTEFICKCCEHGLFTKILWMSLRPLGMLKVSGCKLRCRMCNQNRLGSMCSLLLVLPSKESDDPTLTLEVKLSNRWAKKCLDTRSHDCSFQQPSHRQPVVITHCSKTGNDPRATSSGYTINREDILCSSCKNHCIKTIYHTATDAATATTAFPAPLDGAAIAAACLHSPRPMLQDNAIDTPIEGHLGKGCKL